jgi:hypothetical protein
MQKAMEAFRDECGGRFHWGKAGWPYLFPCFDGFKLYGEGWCDFGCAVQVGFPCALSHKVTCHMCWNWPHVTHIHLRCCVLTTLCVRNGLHRRCSLECGGSNGICISMLSLISCFSGVLCDEAACTDRRCKTASLSTHVTSPIFMPCLAVHPVPKVLAPPLATLLRSINIPTQIRRKEKAVFLHPASLLSPPPFHHNHLAMLTIRIGLQELDPEGKFSSISNVWYWEATRRGGASDKNGGSSVPFASCCTPEGFNHATCQCTHRPASSCSK